MRRFPVALLAGLAAALAVHGDGGDEEKAGLGATIYARGEAPATREVLIGEPPSRAPLALFACRGCHGDDGRGVSEGGVVAPEIRWSYLTRPYAVPGGSFRRRPAYDRQLFARALRDGVDSAGQPFGAAMPRYPLADGEIAALAAYLRRLDQPAQASPFGAELPVGVRLPAAGGEVLRRVIDAYFGEIDRGGGLFERRIRLRYQNEDEPFRSGLAAGLDLAIPQLGAGPPSPADEVPVVALFPAAAPAPETRFALYSGPEDRAAVLLLFAGRRLGIAEEKVAIRGDETPPPSSATPPAALLFTGRDAARLEKHLAGLPAELPLLLTGWLESPPLMEIARRHLGRVYVATPPTPQLLGESGRRRLARLAAATPLPAEQPMVQLWALAAAYTLETALEKAGRDLQPAALPGIFESLADLETGFGPDLRFSPARHLGARGAVVLQLGRDGTIAAWQWVALAGRGD